MHTAFPQLPFHIPCMFLRNKFSAVFVSLSRIYVKFLHNEVFQRHPHWVTLCFLPSRLLGLLWSCPWCWQFSTAASILARQPADTILAPIMQKAFQGGRASAALSPCLLIVVEKTKSTFGFKYAHVCSSLTLMCCRRSLATNVGGHLICVIAFKSTHLPPHWMKRNIMPEFADSKLFTEVIR